MSTTKRLFRVVTEVSPLIVAFFLQIFIQGEVAYTATIIAVIMASWLIRYQKNEWILFVLGVVVGFLFEAIGGLVYRTQFWEDASLLGIPMWLPLLWGYAFVHISRIGSVIVSRES